MAQLIILGSSNAIPSRDHENTHMALTTHERTILIDCVSNPVVRLEQAGDVSTVTDIILTHFHPDHVSGVPLLLMDMWLMGRRQPLNIYGLHYTLDRMETMMGLYGWIEWPNFFTVNFCRIPADDVAIVLDAPDMCVYSSPAKHFLPNIGLRFELKAAKKTFAYSCDTEPCAAMLDLARGVDILLHEAAGPFMGHSSAAQAGEVARQAGVGVLYLIHYPTGRYASGDLVAEAQTRFQGEVKLAADFMKIDLDGPDLCTG
jgi:ribonuclease Z